jgi:hypothetical protein
MNFGELTATITDTPEKFRAAVLQGIAAQLNKALKKSFKSIKSEVSAKLGRIFQFSPVYSALISGELGPLLGLPDTEARSRVDEIIAAIVLFMEYELIPLKVHGNNITGGVEVRLLQADFADILSLPAASIKDKDGREIPWLEWLLVRGDSIIIGGYRVDFGPHPKSRSGDAIMVRDDSVGWRVPPEYSGVINDNWLTRAIDNGFTIIRSILLRAIERHIKAVLNVLP